jgi:hypothetical protein
MEVRVSVYHLSPSAALAPAVPLRAASFSVGLQLEFRLGLGLGSGLGCAFSFQAL